MWEEYLMVGCEKFTVKLSCKHTKTLQIPIDFDVEDCIASTYCSHCREERMISKVLEHVETGA